MSATVHHPKRAAEFIEREDNQRAKWHDKALWFVRAKRDKIAGSLPEWERLRELASQIKLHSVSRLADYLEEFTANAEKLGATIHWARDAEEHNEIVHRLLTEHNAKKIVKSKSMLTEECGLNHYLEKNGIEVIDTDLGERIVQLRNEGPSHIVLPAIHIKKGEVGETFHEHLGTEKGSDDPDYLTEAARQHLRERFLAADAGITGVNFAIAETGGIVICTNEGNADLGVSLPKLHIACMGLEKIIPRANDLSVFIRLLARSATGQPITTYTSHFHGPREGAELHIVLVDNGRSELLGSESFRRSLNCIRCGACMNTCPVYRRTGGHSYGVTVPGPIGSILNPARDPVANYSLPFACSLCGSCTDVCPVKIDLHHQLLNFRKEIAVGGNLPFWKAFPIRVAGFFLRRPGLYKWAGAFMRMALRWFPRWMLYNRFNDWGRQRELPEPPARSFRDAYATRKQQRTS